MQNLTTTHCLDFNAERFLQQQFSLDGFHGLSGVWLLVIKPEDLFLWFGWKNRHVCTLTESLSKSPEILIEMHLHNFGLPKELSWITHWMTWNKFISWQRNYLAAKYFWNLENPYPVWVKKKKNLLNSLKSSLFHSTFQNGCQFKGYNKVRRLQVQSTGQRRFSLESASSM